MCDPGSLPAKINDPRSHSQMPSSARNDRPYFKWWHLESSICWNPRRENICYADIKGYIGKKISAKFQTRDINLNRFFRTAYVSIWALHVLIWNEDSYTLTVCYVCIVNVYIIRMAYWLENTGFIGFARHYLGEWELEKYLQNLSIVYK